MNLFIISLVITCFTFVLSYGYYNLIFDKIAASLGNSPQHNQYQNQLSVGLATFCCLFVTALVYGTFGLTMNLFYTAPLAMPYIIALMFWLLIAGAELLIAIRIRQPHLLTFIHLLFWILIMLIYSLLFPIAIHFYS